MKKSALPALGLLAVLLAASTNAAHAQAPAGDAARGQARAQMCVGCHNIVGYQATFPEVYKVPMIAGQNAKYIANALTAYQKGERRHPTMRGIAQPLTEQDMADLGAYYESLGQVAGRPSAQAAAPGTPAMPESIREKAAACAACHGANFNAPVDPSYPKLAGQHPDYLAVTLRAYRTHNNAVAGRDHPIMGAQLELDAGGKKGDRFTRAELRELARYLAALPGDLRTVPNPRIR